MMINEGMRCLLLLLLLPLPILTNLINYYGILLSYYPRQTNIDGSITVEYRYKDNSQGCNDWRWDCHYGNCGTEISWTVGIIDYEPGYAVCQTEVIWIQEVPTNEQFEIGLWWTSIYNHAWISPTVNGIMNVKCSSVVELRNRSDTGQINKSPQTTIVPIVRVPSNCPKYIRFLVLDPDGDLVRCRYADNSINPAECDQCTPPSVLSLSPTCTLSFSPTDNSNQGLYAVLMMMEDFPKTNIILSLANGSQEERTTNNSISQMPVQFVFSVEAAAPSCSEGLYLPRFVEPTPEHGAQLNVNVNQTLEIMIKAEANMSTISDLWFSGPSNMNMANSGGQYILSWVPSATEDGRSFPVCFTAEAVINTSKYQSELRCVTVMVGNSPTPSSPLTTVYPLTVTNGTTVSPVTVTDGTTVSPVTVTNGTTVYPVPVTNGTTVYPITTSATAAPNIMDPMSTSTSSMTTTMATSTTLPEPSTVTTPDSGTTQTNSPTLSGTTDVNTVSDSTKNGDNQSSNQIIVFLQATVSSPVPLSAEEMKTVLQQFKDELVKRGMPPNITLNLVTS